MTTEVPVAKDIIFVFPGLSGHKPGAFNFLLQCKEAQRVFDAADAVLVEDGGMPLTDLMTNSKFAALLNKPEYSLPASVAFGLAIFEVAKRRIGFELSDISSSIAGYSIGQCAAIYAAGGLSLEDTFSLSRTCGKLAQEYKGGMALISGEKATKITEEIIADVNARNEQARAYISNLLTSDRVIISGNNNGISAVSDIIGDTLKVLRLPITVPFHSPLTELLSGDMRLPISSKNIGKLSVPLIGNADAKPVSTPDEVRQVLFKMISEIVDWQGCMNKAHSLGARTVVECGGVFLAPLARSINQELRGIPLASPEAIEGFIGRCTQLNPALATPAVGG